MTGGDESAGKSASKGTTGIDRSLTWQQRALQFLQVVFATAFLPGGAVVIVYSLHYGFFPYLAGAISSQVLIFITVIVGFVFSVGLTYGFVCSAWAQIILIWCLPASRRTHPLLPATRRDRLGFALLSLLLFLVFGAYAWLSAVRKISPDFFYLFLYFFSSSFLMSMVLTGLDLRKSGTWKLAAPAALFPIALLVVLHQALMPLLDTSMAIMGFRSSPDELVLVSPEALRQIVAITELYGRNPDTCAMTVGDRKMLLIRSGTVVWKGALPRAFVDTGDLAVPAIVVQGDDVLVLPRVGATTCTFVRGES